MRIQLKSTLLSAIGAFALVSAVTLYSCKEDKCKSVVCAYGGVCQPDGSCKCQIGYEGERCETVTRDKFKGVWSVVESGTASKPAFYPVSVENGNNINEVLIRNFYNQNNAEIMATVVQDTITIPLQQFQVGEQTLTVQGRGVAVPEAFYGLHGKIIFTYVITFEDGSKDMFGMNGDNNPSIWTK